MKPINSPDNLSLENKDLYIFDFDGVLVDSVDLKTRAFAEIYLSYGTQVVEQVVLHHTKNGGMSRYDKFRHYHNNILGQAITSKVIEELSERFSSLVVEKIITSDEVEGVSDILDFCKQQKIICTIVSATPKDELRKIVELRGWAEGFKFVYGSPESKVDNIKKTLKATSISKSKAIFFGDSTNDYDAAKACGIDFVGINFLSGDKSGFRNFLSENNFFS